MIGKRSIVLVLASFTVMLCLCLDTTAENVESRITETNVTHEIVVTATRRETLLRDTPDIVKIISKKDIEEIHPSKTGDAIELSTGTAVSTGTGSGLPNRSVISINGLPPNYTLVLLDGVPLLTEHIHTGQNLELIPPQNIERIEIMRGASSAQYGSDAIGGIVNIISRKSNDKPEASIHASAASYNTYDAGFSLMLPTSEASDLSFIINQKQSDGIPLTLPKHRINDTGYDQLNLMTSFDSYLSDATKLLISINMFDYSMDWRGGKTDSYFVTPSIAINHDFSEDFSWYNRVSYSKWQADLNTEENIFLRPESHFTWKTSTDNTVIGGIDLKREEFERNKVGEHARNAYGIFLQDELIRKDVFSVMTALRADKVEDIDMAFSPKISAMLAATETTRVRLSVGRGFHAPSLMELYEEGYGHGGRAYRFGNPELDPEYSTTYTMGLETTPFEPVQVMINGFYSDIKDMIVPVYNGTWDQDQAIDVWRRTNIDNAQVYGGEAQVMIKVSSSTKLEGGYTYTDNKDKDTGRQLPYSPGSSWYGKLIVARQIKDKYRLTGFVTAKAGIDREAWNWKPVANTAIDNPNGLTTTLDDFVKLDAGLTLTIDEDYEVFVKVENILGEDIENLDDSYTVIDGEPIFQIGIKYNLPFSK